MERLPKWLLCLPLVIQWAWLGLRYRSLTLPSVVNPAIATGGLAGESKLDCLRLIAPAFAASIAPTCDVRPGDDAAMVMRSAGLDYPLVAKPDIGWCGYGVRRIDDAAGLAAYAAAFPAGATWLLQAMAPGPLEAGLLYIRQPGAAAGRIVAIGLRHQPQVTGDGRRSIAELAEADPRLRTHAAARQRTRIPAAGETVLLSTVASLRVGGRYEDGWHLHTPKLQARIDAIAQSMRGLHFARFDVRFAGAAALQNAEFQIIEVNGAGSEAIQFWDARIGLIEAYRGVFRKQADLFALGHALRRAGHRPVGVVALSRAWLLQQRLIRGYPESN